MYSTLDHFFSVVLHREETETIMDIYAVDKHNYQIFFRRILRLNYDYCRKRTFFYWCPWEILITCMLQ